MRPTTKMLKIPQSPSGEAAGKVGVDASMTSSEGWRLQLAAAARESVSVREQLEAMRMVQETGRLSSAIEAFQTAILALDKTMGGHAAWPAARDRAMSRLKQIDEMTKERIDATIAHLQARLDGLDARLACCKEGGSPPR